MTKADIVREIADKTGIDKANVLATVEAFMEIVKTSLANDENVSERFRQLHRQEKSTEDCTQHFKEYYTHHT